MNAPVSAAAWLALGCLVGVVVISAAVLWAAWRRGKSAASPPPLKKMEGPSLVRTWQKEDAQFAELARRTAALRGADLKNGAPTSSAESSTEGASHPPLT